MVVQLSSAFGGSDKAAHDRMAVVMAQAGDAAPGRVVGALQDAARRDGREHEAIDAPQKRRQCLSGTRRGENERRFTARNCGPTSGLRAGRELEYGFEPVADRRMKNIQSSCRRLGWLELFMFRQNRFKTFSD